MYVCVYVDFFVLYFFPFASHNHWSKLVCAVHSTVGK